MEFYLDQKMQQAFANLGLLSVTADALPDVDPTVVAIGRSKLLGTTDPEQMNKMLDLAKQIYR
jgi:iron(III) transport system substrate-binding protein